MEKIAFALAGEEAAWFYVLEQTTIGGRHYILVTEEEGDSEAFILREAFAEKGAESVYEIVEDDTELSAVASVFENLLEDIRLE